jgi:WD40 repeat protein
MMLRTLRKRGGALIAAIALGSTALVVPLAGAAPFDGARNQFAEPRFSSVWTRTDSAAVRGGRSWYWGPNPWFDYAEFYRQGENGLRTVQYFDKARMELNNPADHSGPSQGVTNGLLVKELVSGRVQLGNDPYDYDMRQPADVPVAGNPRNANNSSPGYSAFAGVATIENGYRDPQRLGELVSTTLDRSGNLGQRSDLALPETKIVQYNSVTGHNIPQVLWNFMNLQGRIDTGRVENGPVVDWLFAMGLPITDAYWTRAQVGGEEKDVLVQLFERRVLTYVPSNPAGYKVEMGNVGQHYFQWRYPQLGTPWAAPEPNLPLIYASNMDTGSYWELYLPNNNGGGIRITRGAQETVAYSWRRSWDPAQIALLGDSRRSNAQFRQIYEFDVNAFYSGDTSPNAHVRRLSYSDGTPPPPNGPYPGNLPSGTANDYNASYSPDGTKIIFASDRFGGQELFIMNQTGNSPTQLTSQGCTNESPTWSPNGRRIYWASNCDGDFDIYRADVAYNYDASYSTDARLVNIVNLTNNKSDDRFGRVSPDGKTIAFSSNREGNWELYTVNTENGGGERRLTSNGANDEAPTWSPDGQKLAFASDRDGDYEIYTTNLDGSNVAQITNNTSQDRWPLWAQ